MEVEPPHEIIPMPWQFVEQFKRMERWGQRVEAVCQKVPEDMGDQEDEDDVLAFFQNCFHLKDWIINDEGLEIPKKEVEDFINGSECLKICGDLCIGAKHLMINKPRTDSETRINRTYTVARRITDPILRRDFIVTSRGEKYNALSLARECINTWRRFFSEKGMDWS